MPDFIGLLTRLVDAKVEFVLVGGLAAAAHGSSLITQDVDVCIRLGTENLQRLQDALRDLQPEHRMARPPVPFDHDAAMLGTFRNLYLRTRLGQLDCLGQILGVGDFSKVVADCVQIDLGGTPCRVISLDALIAAKAAMDRDRDRLAAEQLRTIKAMREKA